MRPVVKPNVPGDPLPNLWSKNLPTGAGEQPASYRAGMGFLISGAKPGPIAGRAGAGQGPEPGLGGAGGAGAASLVWQIRRFRESLGIEIRKRNSQESSNFYGRLIHRIRPSVENSPILAISFKAALWILIRGQTFISEKRGSS